jgi:hypothetical protein
MPASYTGQYTVTFGSTDVTSQVINVNVRIGRQKITQRSVIFCL